MGNTSGTGNAALGQSAGNGILGGSYNVALGWGALSATNNNGNNNIVIGKQADISASNVSNEITLGNGDITHFRIPGIGVSFSEGGAVVSGVVTATSFVGDGSALTGISGSGGVTVQDEGSALSTTGTTLNFVGSGVVASGNGATKTITIAGGAGGLTSDAQENTVGGTNAGDSFSGTSATKNTLIGYDCGTTINTGDFNSAYGADALKLLTSGSYNSVFGYEAMDTATTAEKNVVMGYRAATNATSCTNSVFIGHECASVLTSGSHNTIVGGGCGHDLTTGGYNTLVGYKAGSEGSSTKLTTGSNNLLLGHDSAPSSESVSNEITLGDANITKFRIPGINVVLKDNGGTPTTGHVLTVDGSGEASFAAASGGGSGTNPGFSTAGGNFTVNAGVTTVINTFNINTNTKLSEYTIHLENVNGNIQSQKVLVMNYGAGIGLTAYSSEYGIMFHPNQIADIGVVVTSGICSLTATTKSGITGITTFSLTRQDQS